MKKLLLLFSTLLAISASGQTSVYHPFPDSNAYWNFHYTLYCFSGTSNNDYSITISGDTSINSKTYHKLATPFVESSTVGDCIDMQVGYKGAIRQDTALRKVFYVPPTATSEQLLYDFNMLVGDTVKGFIENTPYPPDIVLSVDSVLVGSNYHKRWKINNNYPIYIIEGIGSDYGLIQKSPSNNTDFPYYILNCFNQNGQTLYPGTSTNCQLITSIITIDNTSSQIKVFPNPSNGSFTVDFDNLKNVKEIRILDLLGKIVFQKSINKQSKINIDNLPSGVYILTVIDNENKMTNKKIISSP
jgi:hypothetical protein